MSPSPGPYPRFCPYRGLHPARTAPMQAALLLVWVVVLWLTLAAVAAASPKRVALVVGNAAYEDKPLANPVNDATDVAAALRRLGFEVLERTNRDPQQLREDLADFQDRLAQGDVGLFYFAGHGVQTGRGLNYLLPVGVNYRRERDAELHGLEAGAVLRRLEESSASLSLVILDACRDSPLPPEARSAGARGLGRMDAHSGSLIAFATAPGRTADDNTRGRNGLYTAALLRHLETPGLRLEDVFQRVRVEVERATNRLQSPEEVSKLTTPFYFRPATAAAQAPSPTTSPAPLPPLPAPPAPGTLNLADLQRQQQQRQEWQAWQGRMRQEFDRVAAASLAADLQVVAWERFLQAWKDDNPLSGDDEALRAQAQQRLADARRAQQPATAPGVLSAAQTARPAGDLRHGQMLRDCDVCPELAVISDLRRFQMGSPPTEPLRGSDEDQRWVQVSKPYAIGKTEVTQAQWRAVMGSNPSRFQGCDECPVETVSWDDVQQYIQRLNERTGNRYRFRLPSEAEWEYAARAGTTTPFWTGQTITTAQANFDGREPYNGGPRGTYQGRTTPVKQFPANPWGLHDVHGNVWEWVQDCWGRYSEAPADGTAKGPEGAGCFSRVLRGGSWDDVPARARAADRIWGPPGYRDGFRGFRLARMLS